MNKSTQRESTGSSDSDDRSNDDFITVHDEKAQQNAKSF